MNKADKVRSPASVLLALVLAFGTATGLAVMKIFAQGDYEAGVMAKGAYFLDKLRGMQAYGAQLVRVGSAEGGLATADRDQTAAHIAAQHGAYWTQQHNNPGNSNGYQGLADEPQPFRAGVLILLPELPIRTEAMVQLWD